MKEGRAVPIPKRDHGIGFKTIKGLRYVYYTSGYKQNPETKKWSPQTKCIGRVNPEDPTTMFPNENFEVYFPEESREAREAEIEDMVTELEDESDEDITGDSFVHQEWVTKVGVFIVVRQIVERLGLVELLKKAAGNLYALFLDLMTYMIVCEDNTGWHYPAYGKEHALFTPGMRVVSDSTVSRLYQSIPEGAVFEFLDGWNATLDHSNKVYVCYDSTNKNCQAGDVDMADYGNAKEDPGKPIFNYAVAYDLIQEKPLLYEYYAGCINDVTELQTTIETLRDYGYRSLAFIIDRGYFSAHNIKFMDKNGYDFVIMAKGLRPLVHDLVSAVRGSFESDPTGYIADYRTYGTTVVRKLYPGDTKDRYFHIFFNPSKAAHEQAQFMNGLEDYDKWLSKRVGKRFAPSKEIRKYYALTFNAEGMLVSYERNIQVIRDELEHAGYFVLITSEEMSARQALELYKSRDVNEKVFRIDKSYLGNCSARTHSSESTRIKVFLSFGALIVRNEMYVSLKKRAHEIGGQPDYMTVEGAIDLLENIKIVRTDDYKYRMACKISKKQRQILSAFSITPNAAIKQALTIGAQLRENAERDPRTKIYQPARSKGPSAS